MSKIMHILSSFLLLALVKCQELPATYPAGYAIPPVIDSFVNSFNLNGATPATVHLSCSTANTWCLTYDDGPSPLTPTLLDFLLNRNIKATFFVVGTQVIQFPAILKRAFDEGHEIALHSWSHSNFTLITQSQMIMELGWNIKAIRDVIGVSPRLFRPPFGAHNAEILQVAGAMGLSIVIWNQDTDDWKLRNNVATEAEILSNVNTIWLPTLPTGSILSLQHDLELRPINLANTILGIASGSGARLILLSTCLNENAYSTTAFAIGDNNGNNVGATYTFSGDSPTTTVGNNKSASGKSSFSNMCFSLSLLLLVLAV